MERRRMVGLIAIVTIVAVTMFAGCVEELKYKEGTLAGYISGQYQWSWSGRGMELQSHIYLGMGAEDVGSYKIAVGSGFYYGDDFAPSEWSFYLEGDRV